MVAIFFFRKANSDTKKDAVPLSKTASMTDDPFVVLETASASDSAYTSPGRSTDPLEDLDKSAKSEGKNANHTDVDDSFFKNPSAFDQVLGSDPLFASDTNGHMKNINSKTSSRARDSSPVHHSVNGNPARKSSMEDLGHVMPKSHSAMYSDIHGDDIDQSPISTESEDHIWLTVSEIPLFTETTSAPPPSRAPPLLKQKPQISSVDDLGGFARGKPQVPVYDNNGFDEDFERDSSDREEKDRQESLERDMRLREEKQREQRRLEKGRELEQQRERERQAVEKATKEARERATAEARAKAERESRQRAQRAAVQRAQQEARERAAAEAKERAARVAAEARERAAAEAKEKAVAEAKERERTAARERATAERAAAERAQQEARKRAERAAVERAAAESRERQAAAAATAAREKQSTPDDLESFFGASAGANSAPKQRAPTPSVVSYICQNV
jgi:chemotaxis protein histidine kinase CheA